eukprot:s218_g28.t1
MGNRIRRVQTRGVQKEPASIVRGAMVGPSDGVRDRPRRQLAGRKSMEELLAQLDLDEARDWEAIRPSARVEVGSGSVPSIEELLVQLDVEDERDRSD